MEFEEAIKICKDFIMHCRFTEKRKYNDEQLFKAIEYFAFNDLVPKKKIKNKIKEYLEYDKKVKTYTSNGRENFTIEYYKAKTLQELLEDK